MSNIGLQLSAAKIKRYHTAIIVGEQNVGEHTYGVCQLVRHFTNDNWSKELMCAALDHDVLEFYTGDMPHPTKKMFPDLKAALDVIEDDLREDHLMAYSLTEEERVILRCADLLESAQFGLYQLALGNQYGRQIIGAIELAFNTMDSGKVPQAARDMMVEVTNVSQ